MAKEKKPAEGEATEGKEKADGKPKKGKRKRVIMLLALVLLAGGGFEYMKMAKKHVAAGQSGPTTTVGGPLTEETSLTVNLRDNHYLEFTVAIQTAPGQSDKVLTKDQPIVLDILNSQAEDMTETQLLQPGGPAALKAHIVEALNQRWPGLVQAVYFEQFVMQ